MYVSAVSHPERAGSARSYCSDSGADAWPERAPV